MTDTKRLQEYYDLLLSFSIEDKDVERVVVQNSKLKILLKNGSSIRKKGSD